MEVGSHLAPGVRVSCHMEDTPPPHLLLPLSSPKHPLTSFRPRQTPLRVAASAPPTPSLRMGMMRVSTRSPILRQSSPTQRDAMI